MKLSAVLPYVLSYTAENMLLVFAVIPAIATVKAQFEHGLLFRIDVSDSKYPSSN